MLLAMVVAAIAWAISVAVAAAVTTSMDVGSEAYATAAGEPQRYQWLDATAVSITAFGISQTQQIMASRPRSAAYVMLRDHITINITSCDVDGDEEQLNEALKIHGFAVGRQNNSGSVGRRVDALGGFGIRRSADLFVPWLCRLLVRCCWFGWTLSMRALNLLQAQLIFIN